MSGQKVEDGPLYTVKEAAALLKVHYNTVYRYINEGIIPAIRLGVSRKPRIRIKAEIINHLMEKGFD